MDNVTEEDWKAAPALQETPVTSAICQPVNGAELEEGTEEVSGECVQASRGTTFVCCMLPENPVEVQNCFVLTDNPAF